MTTTVMDALARAAAVLGDRATPDLPLGPLTTYRVGGTAALGVVLRDPSDVDVVARAVAASHVPVVVVGRGSNLLVADRGFEGLAVVLGEYATDVAVAGTRVRAGASVLRSSQRYGTRLRAR